MPFWKLTDFDSAYPRAALITFRLFQAVFLTYNCDHPDEYWQAVEVAYDMVFGGV